MKAIEQYIRVELIIVFQIFPKIWKKFTKRYLIIRKGDLPRAPIVTRIGWPGKHNSFTILNLIRTKRLHLKIKVQFKNHIAKIAFKA